jgi:hypothetical protein
MNIGSLWIIATWTKLLILQADCNLVLRVGLDVVVVAGKVTKEWT